MTALPKSSREPNNNTNPYFAARTQTNFDAKDVHPSYSIQYPNWIQLYDTAEVGSKAVKDKGIEYLPKTEGMEKNDKDNVRYEAYKNRALYRNFCESTIKKAKGLMQSVPALFQLNDEKQLAYLLKSASVKNEGLDSLLRNINDHQLLYGRVGMLGDFPLNGSRQPKIALYNAFSIVNWLEEKDEDGSIFLRFVLLDESGYYYNFNTNKYEEKKQFRLLGLTESAEYGRVYYSKMFDTINISDFNIKEPKDFLIDTTIKKLTIGGKTIDFIPFVVANIKATGMTVEKPLLLEQSNYAISCYQSDADHKAAIRLQAFSLLVISGATKKEIDAQGVQSDGYMVLEDENGKAEYVGVNGNGLSEMRIGIDNAKEEANDSGIVINDKQGVESGKAIKTRVALKTSDLKDIATTGAEALEIMLGYFAKWLNTEKPTVQANTDYTQETDEPRALFEMWQVVQGGGMTWEDFYKYGKDNNWFHDQTFEDWYAKIQQQGSLI